MQTKQIEWKLRKHWNDVEIDRRNTTVDCQGKKNKRIFMLNCLSLTQKDTQLKKNDNYVSQL